MKDLNWYQSQFDEMFLEVLRMTHKTKDIPQAINESYLHLMSDEVRLSMADKADCKRLLNTWLSNTKVTKKKENGFDELTRIKAESDAMLRAKYGN